MDAARVIREARGRSGLTQRELGRSAGMFQPAVARIENGGVIPRADTLARLLAVCGAVLALEPRPRHTERWAGVRSDVQALLRVTPRERLLSLPRKPGSPFRPLDAVRILVGRHVRFVLVGEVAARLHGAPLIPGVLDIAVQRERLNSERLARAVDAMVRQSEPKEGIRAGLRDVRGRGRIRTRFGTIGLWWPTDQTYRRLEGAATEMPLGLRPVPVASIDDVIDRWPRRADERELLAAVREEMDLRALQRRKRRATSGPTRRRR